MKRIQKQVCRVSKWRHNCLFGHSPNKNKLMSWSVSSTGICSTQAAKTFFFVKLHLHSCIGDKRLSAQIHCRCVKRDFNKPSTREITRQRIVFVSSRLSTSDRPSIGTAWSPSRSENASFRDQVLNQIYFRHFHLSESNMMLVLWNWFIQYSKVENKAEVLSEVSSSRRFVHSNQGKM